MKMCTNLDHRRGALVLPLLLALLALATPISAQTAADSVHVKQAKDTLAAIVKRSTSPTVDRQARWLAAREDSLAKRRARIDTVRLVRVDTVFVAKADTTVVVKPDTAPPVVIVTPGPGPSPVLFTHPFGPPANGAVLAALPQDTVDASYPAIARRYNCSNLQTCLDTAKSGDEVLLAPGSVHRNVVGKPTARTGWVVVRTAITDVQLGGPWERMTPSKASALNLATITSSTTDAPLGFAPSAHHIRLTAARVSTTAPMSNALVRIGQGETSVALLPHHITLDRVVVDPGALDVRRCALLDGAHLAILSSTLANCHSRAGDSQGFLSINGKGPFRVENNTIQGGHQGFMFGGGDPAIVGQVPSDAVIRRNDFTRPYSWRAAGWPAKTILELKIGKRILLEGNVAGGIYPDGQDAFAFLFKSENQDGGYGDWSETSDITARYNRVVGAAGGFNLAPLPNGPGIPMSRIAIYGNELDSIAVTPYRSMVDAVLAQGVADVIVRDNWFRNPDARSALYTFGVSPRFVATGNVWGGQYGMRAEGGFAVTTPGAILTGNTLVPYPTPFASWPASPGDSTRSALLQGVVVAP